MKEEEGEVVKMEEQLREESPETRFILTNVSQLVRLLLALSTQSVE